MTHHQHAVFVVLALILLTSLAYWLRKPGIFANVMKIVYGVGLMIIVHTVWHYNKLS